MCGRFSQEAELSEIKLELKVEQLELFREFSPRYNIAPGYGPGNEQAFVIQTREGHRSLRQGRWWLIPHFWNKPLKELPAAFNARAEDLTRKPFFRDAFREHRCLVPATGWREFRSEAGRRQPYQFRLTSRLFAFAGLWSRWTTPDGEVVDSFAIVTTAPSATAAEYHDRMPLVLPPDLHAAWLDRGADPAPTLALACARARELLLQVYASDPIGNNVRFEGPEVVRPYEPGAAGPEPPKQRASARAARSRVSGPPPSKPEQQELFAARPPERSRKGP